MRFKGFVGPTYPIASLNVECQRTINIYPEIDELHTAADGEIGSLIGTPGTRLLCTPGSGPIRATYTTASGGLLIVVSGREVYTISSAWVPTLIGTIGTFSGLVGISDNGVQVIIVDGSSGYIYTIATQVFAPITAVGFSGGTNVVFQDGYFLVNTPGTGQFQISSLYDGMQWDALDFATAEGSPDGLVTLLTCRRQVWLFGSRTIEVWWNSGASDFPFSRYDGAFIEFGCGAPGSAHVYNNTVLWLGAGPAGDGIVWMAQGYQPVRISNHAVEYAIQQCGDVSGATSYVYQHSGHMFYCLNLPNSLTTWVYDLSTQQWHERATLSLVGAFQRHRGATYAWFANVDIVGDYQSGNLYSLEDATRTDNGTPIRWLRRSPYVSSNMARLFHSRFQIDARMGVGLDGTQQGTAPVMALRYSDDFGATWSQERTRTLGTIGKYKNRAFWDRLGATFTRVYELTGSDPVQIVLAGAELDVK